MINIEEKEVYDYQFFHIDDESEKLEIRGLADAVMAIVLGYSEAVWPE